MTWMLASVTNPEEADIAIQGGADLIDLKDPGRGALGALAPDDIRAIRAVVGDRRPVSATTGDLPPDAATTAEAIAAIAGAGVDYVKVGLFSEAHLDACLPVIAELATACAIVAVLFADRPTARADAELFRTAGCVGIMLDTADKSSGGLRAHLDLEGLSRFVERGRSLGLMTGLAGSLRLTDIQALLPLEPTYLGFRGALCDQGKRTAALDPSRLQVARMTLCPALRAVENDATRHPAWHQEPLSRNVVSSAPLRFNPALRGW